MNRETVEKAFFNKEYERLQLMLKDFMSRPNLTNYEIAWSHLWLGKVLFELGNLDEAKTYLASAFRRGGFELFSNSDAKYLEHIKTFVGGRLRRSSIARWVLLISTLFLLILPRGLFEVGFAGWSVFWIFFVVFLLVVVPIYFYCLAISPYSRLFQNQEQTTQVLLLMNLEWGLNKM